MFEEDSLVESWYDSPMELPIAFVRIDGVCVEVEFWDESPEELPPARQNACGDCVFGWKERKDVADK